MNRALEPLIHMFRQPIETAKAYSPSKLRGDVLAALSVAVVALPQAMAFALIAGVDPIYGLYGLIVQSLLGSTFSSSSRLSIGPTNTLSLLVASTASRAVGGSGETYLAFVVTLTLLTGLFQIIFAAARMGGLVRYVSHAVIVGFTAGAGVLIIAKQVPNFLGMPLEQIDEKLPGLLGLVQQMAPHITEISWQPILIGTLGIAIMIGARRLSPLIPGPLIAVAVGAAMVAVFGWTQAQLDLVGELPKGILPMPGLPEVQWGLLEQLATGALAIALLGMLEAVAIGKALAARTGEQVNANQEFFAQGLTNFCSGFFSCYPGTGSFSRSALNVMAGARTRFAGAMLSAIVAGALLVAGSLARFIPLASLAAILFVVAYGLIDWRYFRRVLHTDRADGWVCGLTFAATLLIPLEYAVFVGVFFNIALYLRRASRLHMAEMVRTPAGPYQERPVRDRIGEQPVMFLQLEGDLFFGVADELQSRLNKIANSPVRVVILRMKRTHFVDSTVLHVLELFAQNMSSRDRHVLLCGIDDELIDRLESYGLVDQIGPENIFKTRFGVFTSAKMALRRAEQLVGHSIDTDAWGEEDETEGWAYQI